MITLNSIHLEKILHYITLTDYYIVKDTLITNNHSNLNVNTEKNNRVNKMTTLNSIHLEIILHYITLTDYYIVKDTFISQVIIAM